MEQRSALRPCLGFNPYRVFKLAATRCFGIIVIQVVKMFQSLSGFQARCNLATDAQSIYFFDEVSIPIGFSSSLQRQFAVLGGGLTHTVSIPIGFSSSLQPGSSRQRGCSRVVSIPIGFSSSLQPSLDFEVSFSTAEFQSLSGFQARCNLRTWAGGRIGREVSIPIGFSSSLQLLWHPHTNLQQEVSIPIGFSSSLQRCFGIIVIQVVKMFQSLSGFQARCNHDKRHDWSGCRIWVSIPIGFSSSLQPRSSQPQELLFQVSIPIGFSSSLQPTFKRSLAKAFRCFNPYRVFKLAATTLMYRSGLLQASVSIPIGFSSSLQPEELLS